MVRGMRDEPGRDVAALRRFSRSFTRRIGVLDEPFLGLRRPFGEARLLFEIGPAGAGVLELRERLGLDSGYVSRMLRRLEADGVAAVAPDPADRRRRVVTLTDRGRREWDELDRRSDALAAGLLTPLSESQRAALRDALATADRLLQAATITFDTVDPRSPDALWSMGQYFAELDRRFPTGFDPGDTLVADAPAMRAPHGAFVVARADGAPVACGGNVRIDDTTGEIKRMWVHAEWRGAGVGRRLLAHLEDVCRGLGRLRVVLDTNDTLVEAIAMYERSGYAPIERYNDNPYAFHWFAKDL